jgi:hypothetical protein
MLELLIAFALVAFAVTFLIGSPMLFVDKEIKRLEEIEMQRIADAFFSEEKIRLSQDPKTCSEKKGRSFQKEAVSLGLKGISSHQYFIYSDSTPEAHETDKDQKQLWKMKLEIGFTKKNESMEKPIRDFNYIVFIEHIPPKVETNH